MRVFGYALGIAGLVVGVSACESDQKAIYKTWVDVIQQANGTFGRVGGSKEPLNGAARLYYPSGRIHALLNFSQDSLQGRQIWFHPAGYLETTEHRQRGQLQGRKYIFYPSGAVESIRTMHQGLRVNDYYEFYERPHNRLHIHAQFALVQGREWDNGYVAYSPSGQIMSGRGFLRVTANTDTLELGQTLTLKLRVLFPKEKRILASILGYDSAYRLQRPMEEVVITGTNHLVTANLKPQRRGGAEVRGYVSDFKLAGSAGAKQDKTGLDVQERRMYFTHAYYVR